MLREAIQAGNPTGTRVKHIIESGGLIDDCVMTRLVVGRLCQADTAAGFLLEGYTRTTPQRRRSISSCRAGASSSSWKSC